MKLGEKDKKFLFVLAILLILFVPYGLIVVPWMNTAKNYDAQIRELEEEYNQRLDMEAREADYLRKIEEYRTAGTAVLSHFPAEIAQENTIMFIAETERIASVKLSQVGFTETVVIPFGAEKSETSALGEYAGYMAVDNLTFECSYDNFKTFLNYIMNYSDRTVISALTASYNEELDLVTGSFTLHQYAVGGPERQTDVPNTGISVGNGNIFTTSRG